MPTNNQQTAAADNFAVGDRVEGNSGGIDIGVGIRGQKLTFVRIPVTLKVLTRDRILH